MLASYHIWFIIACALAGCELLTGTLYLLAVALGVFAGGCADLFGADMTTSLTTTALVSLAIFIGLIRYKKTAAVAKNTTQELDLGQPVQIIHWHDAQHARIKYRGTQWDAELIDSSQDSTATHYEIAGHKGNTFLIRANK